MPLIGFDRDQPDKGVSKLIERMGFLPHGISVFMFHPDIVHLHDGLAEEKIFPPDNCSYYEDFFADKICKVLTDYGFSGLHVTDNFYPSTGTLFCGDFSTDMLQQFAEHSGTVFPRKVTKGLLDDSFVYFLSVHFSGLGLNFFPKSRIESMLIIWLCHSIRTSR